MGAIFVGGYFDSDSITVGETTLTNQGSYDGMIIKYNGLIQMPEIVAKQAVSLGGEENDGISCVTETSDGGYICRRIF